MTHFPIENSPMRSHYTWKENQRLYQVPGASLVAQTVKNLHVMQETWVRSQGQEDPLEKGMKTHSSILARKIPWTEEPAGLQSIVKVKVKVGRSCLTLRPPGLYSPWNCPGQNTEVGSLSLLQGIFSTQGSNPSLLHCK